MTYVSVPWRQLQAKGATAPPRHPPHAARAWPAKGDEGRETSGPGARGVGRGPASPGRATGAGFKSPAAAWLESFKKGPPASPRAAPTQGGGEDTRGPHQKEGKRGRRPQHATGGSFEHNEARRNC